MTDDSKAILAKCGFDEVKALNTGDPLERVFDQGRKKENARLLPIITKLLEDREILREAMEAYCLDREIAHDFPGTGISYAKHYEAFKNVIAASDALVKEIL